MAEPNILLTRIDNRLVHGQVATQWNSTLGSNLILVANDDVASNTMPVSYTHLDVYKRQALPGGRRPARVH